MSVSWRSHMRWAVAGILLLALLVSLGPGPGAHAERVNQQTSSSESAATSHLVTAIVLDPPSPNILSLNQDVNLTFNYQTTEPGGVRIFARPFTGGALSPNYAAHASPLYPTGSGAGTGSFTISSGPVIVDQVRVQMYNDDQSTLLFEAFLPVYYQFGQVYQVYLPYISKGP